MTTQYKAFTIRAIEREALIRKGIDDDATAIQTQQEERAPHLFALPKKNVWR